MALALAGPVSGARPDHVFGVGLKTLWSEAELAALARRAETPPRRLARLGALQLHLRVSGLDDLVSCDDPIARAGVCRDGDGWRLAMDSRANAVGAPPMAALCAQALAPFALACGTRDGLADLADLRRWDPQAAGLPGVAHNAMIEAPEAVWRWMASRGESADVRVG